MYVYYFVTNIVDNLSLQKFILKNKLYFIKEQRTP